LFGRHQRARAHAQHEWLAFMAAIAIAATVIFWLGQ
jgi:hypothetical protein